MQYAIVQIGFRTFEVIVVSVVGRFNHGQDTRGIIIQTYIHDCETLFQQRRKELAVFVRWYLWTLGLLTPLARLPA